MLVFMVGLFIVGVASAFFLFPSLVDDLIKWCEKKRHLLLVVVERTLVGITLLAGAGATAYPQAIWWLGAAFIAGAVVLAVFPAKTIQQILVSLTHGSMLVVRMYVLLFLALGAFILHSVIMT